MIRVDCVQGSDQWKEARLGIPTASRFSDILTPKKMTLSRQATGYIHELCAEWLLGQPLDEGTSQFMERGTDMEIRAIQHYEITKGVDTEPVGFCLRDDRMVGCSPDRLVGDDGGLEVKVPSAKVHVAYLLGKQPDVYKTQIQGSLWVTKRKWWDFISYHPIMPSVIIRCERDEEYIAALGQAIGEFIDNLRAARYEFEKMGFGSFESRRDAAVEKATAEARAMEKAMFS